MLNQDDNLLNLDKTIGIKLKWQRITDIILISIYAMIVVNKP